MLTTELIKTALLQPLVKRVTIRPFLAGHVLTTGAFHRKLPSKLVVF